MLYIHSINIDKNEKQEYNALSCFYNFDVCITFFLRPANGSFCAHIGDVRQRILYAFGGSASASLGNCGAVCVGSVGLNYFCFVLFSLCMSANVKHPAIVTLVQLRLQLRHISSQWWWDEVLLQKLRKSDALISVSLQEVRKLVKAQQEFQE
ncbi:hypothetical protein [Sulfidibacter corallicola]|uniref:Uncharacterized protein n=1 Tax=Sulfidibacter corallicola TaxID=2818388 RepID=A0A8A4TRT7_SULCO|nr:hypothetical protein [Sulfidibacter corallicola]QTD52107.1 hypothetical protein J3U87_06500 [Sulfidibacter corallicola]